MDARRFTGPKTVTIHVTVGPEYTSTATLQVSANSRSDVVFNPGEVNFGVVPHGRFTRVGFAQAIVRAERGAREDIVGRTHDALRRAGALREARVSAPVASLREAE